MYHAGNINPRNHHHVIFRHSRSNEAIKNGTVNQEKKTQWKFYKGTEVLCD